MNNFPIIKDLGKLCEYIYRKGVADAASSGDIPEIKRVAEGDDNYTTPMFLNEENGDEIKEIYYRDYLAVYCNKLKAHSLKNFLIYAEGVENKKKSICILVDYIYRKGLIDGSSKSRSEGLDYFDKVNYGMVHNRLDGTKLSHFDWLEEIKHYTNIIASVRKRSNIPGNVHQLSGFIGEAVRSFKNSSKK